MRNPVIAHAECIGCGACEALCPKVFELRDDGLAYVKEGSASEDLKDCIQAAIDDCPTAAISWDE